MAEWNKKGLPHKGWKCLDVIDLAEYVKEGGVVPYEQCEMCGNEKIRYAHVMIHPDFQGEIHVGCICAEKMTDDYVNPRKRENELKNMALRKRNFNKVQWNYNPIKRTYSKKYKGEYITIKQSIYGNWGVFFANHRIWEYDGQKMSDFNEAEDAAFYVFEEYHTTHEERLVQYFRNQYNEFD